MYLRFSATRGHQKIFRYDFRNLQVRNRGIRFENKKNLEIHRNRLYMTIPTYIIMVHTIWSISYIAHSWFLAFVKFPKFYSPLLCFGTGFNDHQNIIFTSYIWSFQWNKNASCLSSILHVSSICKHIHKRILFRIKNSSCILKFGSSLFGYTFSQRLSINLNNIVCSIVWQKVCNR